MTTITNTDDAVFLAILLKAHLKLLSVGMKHSRMSGKDVLAKASAVTGVAYKRGQYALALADLNTFITEHTNG